MPELNSSSVEAVIENGIKHPIRLLLKAGRYPAVRVLTYSGMDTMAFLGMPATKVDVTRSDFIVWAERYIKVQSPDPPTGQDL